MSEKERIITSLSLIGISILTGYLIITQPEQLKVPYFIAFCGLGVFMVAGIGIGLYGRIGSRYYHFLMQGMILLMSIIPLWIAFDPGKKQCKANLIFLSGELPCRIGIGIGGIIILGVLLLSFTKFLREK